MFDFEPPTAPRSPVFAAPSSVLSRVESTVSTVFAVFAVFTVFASRAARGRRRLARIAHGAVAELAKSSARQAFASEVLGLPLPHAGSLGTSATACRARIPVIKSGLAPSNGSRAPGASPGLRKRRWGNTSILYPSELVDRRAARPRRVGVLRR